MHPRFGISCFLLLGLLGPLAAASPQKDLEKATEREEVIFLLVTGEGATGVEQARDLIHQVMKEVDNSTLVVLDRSDAANADLVARFRVASVPVPLILIVAPNGVTAGGVPAAKATAEKLLTLVPSPRKAEMLQALNNGKAIFAVAGRGSMDTQAAALAACTAACGQMGGASVVIMIDMDDPAEVAFLTQIKVDTASAEPVTVVVNPQGQFTGRYTGTPEVADLVAAATKRVAGCCPSSVQNPNASCAPKK
jgi:hypothetical protein